MKSNSNKIIPAVCLVLAALFAVFSFTSIIKGKKTFRTVMYFPSYEDGTIYTEVRNLPKDSVQGDERLFVDDILLGPLTNHYRRLLPSGTSVEFFTVGNDGTAYLGLSRQALRISSESADIKTGVSLLKMNIVKNFTKINTVLVYVDGKSVYEKAGL